MENPGSIRTGKRQMLKGGVSDPRNKVLMKMFNLIGYGERAGSGVPDIFSVWDNQGLNRPEIEKQHSPDRTILTLPLTKKTSDKKQSSKTVENMQLIREYLEQNGICKVSDISELFELSQARVRVILKEMKDVQAEGNNKNRQYRCCKIFGISSS